MYAKAVGFLILAAFLAAVIAVRLIILYRRQIAKAADKAAINTLAAGLKAKRNAGSRLSDYRKRIEDRADDH